MEPTAEGGPKSLLRYNDLQKRPIKPGVPQYRCQRCDVLEDGVMVEGLALALFEHAAGRMVEGMLPYRLHTCADGGIGVAVCVGGVERVQTQETP